MYLLAGNEVKWNSHKLVAIGKKRAFYGIEWTEAIPENTM